jgi:hypothetical protein
MVIIWFDHDHDECGMWMFRNILIASVKTSKKSVLIVEYAFHIFLQLLFETFFALTNADGS